MSSSNRSMNSHFLPHKGKTDEWLTPPEIIQALGPFDLDPCSPIVRPWDTARTHYNIIDDGLSKDWFEYRWFKISQNGEKTQCNCQCHHKQNFVQNVKWSFRQQPNISHSTIKCDADLIHIAENVKENIIEVEKENISLKNLSINLSNAPNVKNCFHQQQSISRQNPQCSVDSIPGVVVAGEKEQNCDNLNEDMIQKKKFNYSKKNEDTHNQRKEENIKESSLSSITTDEKIECENWHGIGQKNNGNIASNIGTTLAPTAEPQALNLPKSTLFQSQISIVQEPSPGTYYQSVKDAIHPKVIDQSNISGCPTNQFILSKNTSNLCNDCINCQMDKHKYFIYMNPPYSQMVPWMEKMVAHNNGIAFIFARTDTEWFFNYVWSKASSLFFVRQRPHFYYPDGIKAKSNSGGPVVLVGYGKQADLRLEDASKFGLRGKYVKIN